VGGTADNEGTLEVCQNNRWAGTVCDDFWDSTDAAVACRQLGFRTDSRWSMFPNRALALSVCDIHIIVHKALAVTFIPSIELTCILQMLLLCGGHSLARGRGPSSWTMWSAQGMRADL